MRRLARRWVGKCGLQHPSLHIRPKSRKAARTGLVTQQARDTLPHKAFLPTQDSGFTGPATAHNRRRAATIGGQ
jgi:hypothetical protein